MNEQGMDLISHVLRWPLADLRSSNVDPLHGAKPLKLAYGNTNEYMERFLPFVLEETRATITAELMKTAVQNGLEPLFQVAEVKGDHDVKEMEMRPKAGAAVPDAFRALAVVLLRPTIEKSLEILGVASMSKDGFGIKVKVRSMELGFDLKKCKTWHVKYITSIVSQKRMFDVCNEKPRIALLRSLIGPGPKTTNLPETGSLQNGLNKSQSRVVDVFTKDKGPPNILLVQGPPGTGKTTTTVSVLKVLAQKRKRTLVCAPSNKAIQVLAERFTQLDKENVTSIPFIVVGVENKVSVKLQTVFLDSWYKKGIVKKLNKLFEAFEKQKAKSVDAKHYIRFQNGVRAVERELTKFKFQINDSLQKLQMALQNRSPKAAIKRHFEFCRHSTCNWGSDKVQRHLLNNSTIIFATLSVSGRSSLARMDHVDVLIVDEAGQTVEAETLIALRHNPKQFMLVGDTKQLCATVISPRLQDDKTNFSLSMMERLERLGFPQLMLDTQYRMHPEIAKWPSDFYYHGKLQNGTNVARAPQASIPLLNAPLAFYDIDEGREHKVDNKSLGNQSEAKYVLACVQAIRKVNKDCTIGVISFYAEQVDTLKNTLKRFLDKVTVNTVDGFQGDERDIIILTCVRSNRGGAIGFVSDSRRLNVAITRAKHNLIILGHLTTLNKRNHDVKSMLKSLGQRRMVSSTSRLSQLIADHNPQTSKTPVQVQPGIQKNSKKCPKTSTSLTKLCANTWDQYRHVWLAICFFAILLFIGPKTRE